MVQLPRALGLFFCERVIFERDTNRPSLIGLFGSLRVPRVPTVVPRFDVFASLTDGLGKVTVELVVTSLRTDEQVSSYRAEATFPDPLRVIHSRVPLIEWEVREAWAYLFSLLVNGEEVAQRRLSINLLGE
jgi:hypothetical protein